MLQFWSIALSPDRYTTTVRYGKHGTRGNPEGLVRTKTHSSPAEAAAYIENLIRVKIREGFVENQTGRTSYDGGVAAAIEEVDEEERRATRSGVQPTPKRSRKRVSTGTGKRKSKKAKMESESEEEESAEPEDSSLGAGESPPIEMDHEAADVIQDTIAMFEAEGEETSGLDEDEMGMQLIGEQMPTISPVVAVAPAFPTPPPPPEPEAELTKPEPSQPESREEMPAQDDGNTIRPIVAPPSPTPEPETRIPRVNVETNVTVQEIRTAEEEAETRKEEGYDETPPIPLVREPSEEPAAKEEKNGALKVPADVDVYFAEAEIVETDKPHVEAGSAEDAHSLFPGMPGIADFVEI